MQNMWVRDPHRLRNAIERNGEAYRRRVIHYALFAGCLSGRRIKAAFGDMTDIIKWDEVSREISGHASFKPTPDIEHVKDTIAEYKPQIILAFGAMAREAVILTGWKGTLISLPHPAARIPGIGAQLDAAAAELKSQIAK